MVMNLATEIKAILSQIKDPELPFLSIQDLGILREVKEENGTLKVIITPTFSGCPAMRTIEEEIRSLLTAQKILSFSIEKQLAPPWRSSDITPQGRKNLFQNGIAVEDEGLICPLCSSKEIRKLTPFGATACKSFAKCHQCSQTFEFFKSHG